VKVLLDACVWGGAIKQLRDAGHDIVWVGDWDKDPGDDAILAYAHLEERVVATIDKDFGELAVLHGMPHHGILRIVNFSVRRHSDVCLAALESHGTELLAGALVTAEPGRMRVRPAQKQRPK